MRFLSCAARHAELRAAAAAVLPRLTRAGQVAAAGGGVRSEVEGRIKGVWSTWLKALATGTGFEGIADVVGVRVLVGSVADCYRVLHELQRRWTGVGPVDDYIQQPKRNGYQSLHAVLRDVSGTCFEVQVRTRRMHAMCESGRADHPRYKREQMDRAAVALPPLPSPGEPSWLRTGRPPRGNGGAFRASSALWDVLTQPRPWMARNGSALGLATIAVVGLLDYLTGHAVGFAIFYLLPISVSTWWVGRRFGSALAALSTIVWWTADRATAPLPVEMATSVWNAAMRLGIFLFLVHSLAALHDALRREEAMSSTDHLTRLGNGRAFLDAARNELSRARRYGRPLSVVFIDLDDLGGARRRLGEIVVDEMLKEWARVLRAATRDCDRLARLSDGEFALLMPEASGPSARAALSRLVKEMETASGQLGWRVSFSIGAISFVTPPDSVESMIRETDVLVSSARRGRGDRWLHEVRDGGSSAGLA